MIMMTILRKHLYDNVNDDCDHDYYDDDQNEQFNYDTCQKAPGEQG